MQGITRGRLSIDGSAFQAIPRAAFPAHKKKLATSAGTRPLTQASRPDIRADGLQQGLTCGRVWSGGPAPPPSPDFTTREEVKSARGAGFHVVMPGEVEAFFVFSRKCEPGESWVVCGDDEDLGNWDPDKSLKLQWAEGHNWWATTDFVPDKEVTFKVLLKRVDRTYDWDAVTVGNISLACPGDHECVLEPTGLDSSQGELLVAVSPSYPLREVIPGEVRRAIWEMSYDHHWGCLFVCPDRMAS